MHGGSVTLKIQQSLESNKTVLYFCVQLWSVPIHRRNLQFSTFSRTFIRYLKPLNLRRFRCSSTLLESILSCWLVGSCPYPLTVRIVRKSYLIENHICLICIARKYFSMKYQLHYWNQRTFIHD